VKAGIASNGLVLPKRREQIDKGLFRDIEQPHAIRQCHEYWMPWGTRITRVQFPFPFIQQPQRCCGIPYFIPKVVGDPAICVQVAEMLPQPLWQKPCGH